MVNEHAAIPKSTSPKEISTRLWFSPVNNENSPDWMSSVLLGYFRKLLIYQYFLYFPIFYFTTALSGDFGKTCKCGAKTAEYGNTFRVYTY